VNGVVSEPREALVDTGGGAIGLIWHVLYPVIIVTVPCPDERSVVLAVALVVTTSCGIPRGTINHIGSRWHCRGSVNCSERVVRPAPRTRSAASLVR